MCFASVWEKRGGGGGGIGTLSQLVEFNGAISASKPCKALLTCPVLKDAAQAAAASTAGGGGRASSLGDDRRSSVEWVTNRQLSDARRGSLFAYLGRPRSQSGGDCRRGSLLRRSTQDQVPILYQTVAG